MPCFLRCHSDVMALICLKALVSQQGALRVAIVWFLAKDFEITLQKKSPNGLGSRCFLRENHPTPPPFPWRVIC